MKKLLGNIASKLKTKRGSSIVTLLVAGALIAHGVPPQTAVPLGTAVSEAVQQAGEK